MIKKKSGKRGSSLVEMIIAIALFAIVSIPLFGTFLGAASLMKKSKENIEMSAIIRQVKAEVLGVSSVAGGMLPNYLDGIENKQLPANPGDYIDDYGIANRNTGEPNYKYKYSIKYLKNEAGATDKVYAGDTAANDSLNVDPTPIPEGAIPGGTVKKATRYRINIYALSSAELDRMEPKNFTLVKYFYIETKYE